MLELAGHDLVAAFHRIGKERLLPTLQDPEPVMVWNRPKMYGGIAYANEICCRFQTTAGPQDIWGMPVQMSPYFEASMGTEGSAKLNEIKRRAEAGELRVDAGPNPPTERTIKALPPLDPQPAGVRLFPPQTHRISVV